MICIDISFDGVDEDKCFLNKELCEKIVRECLREKSIKEKSPSDMNISVLMTNDEHMRALNKQYRGMDAPTDVLTFAALDDDKAPSYSLGDIVISPDMAKENVKGTDIKEKEEQIRLFVHGFMHLLGFDHATNDFEQEEMLRLQEDVLKKLYKLYA